MEIPKLKFKKLVSNAQLPTRAHGPEEDAGMDLYASEKAEVYYGKVTIVKTGLAMELPPGLEAQIRPRSGLSAKHGITVVNTPGTIDPGYRGEISVIMTKLKQDVDNEPFIINPGDRIAQMVLGIYAVLEPVEVEELSDSNRNTGGMGSTGIH